MMAQRVQIAVRGAVQGVGFRPFIHRLATELGLSGWVLNSSRGVVIEAEGSRSRLEAFLLRIKKEKPPRSFIQDLEFSFRSPVGYAGFEIRQSDKAGDPTALVLPDIAVCPDCLGELFDPMNRRYLYPFTSCTHCGPRFTIIESLPYDRANTTMKRFGMCDACRGEYEDPLDRRFHAQPNACPVCGPQLELWDGAARVLSRHREAWVEAAAAIRSGKIVAVKGLGGFHLIADARQEAAVVRLRERKHREEKPFALMVPSLEGLREVCEVSDPESRLLLSPESPIVLLRRRSEPPGLKSQIAPSVAPDNPDLGVLLPYTPLHHVLMRELGFPVVATSGNVSDEPICTDEREAVDRLRGIADLFLVHDRSIVRPVDDSVVRMVMGRELVLRRARGYAPLPVRLKEAAPPLLAVGGHLKNTVALTAGRDVFLSQHLGDLETREAFEAFQNAIAGFRDLYPIRPGRTVCDLHPDYISTRYAKGLGNPVTAVQHHWAHVASCMAENELDGPVLGVSWDGAGYGPDGTIWGGEFLLTDASAFRRVASFRRFRLPGGATAIREPRRTAAGLRYEIAGERLFDPGDPIVLRFFTPAERAVLRTMLTRGIHSPLTSSVGRLFDAVASIVGLRQRVSFEGQAAMELEFAIGDERTEEAYPFRTHEAGETYEAPLLIVDWEPMIKEMFDDQEREVPIRRISAKFHNALAEIIVAVAGRIGEERVALTGGCFQNKYLTERAVHRLDAAGFRPYWHRRVPPNDGGLALGQIFVAHRKARAIRKGIETQALDTKGVR
ncbi:MAG TPA: carbamoyltransferase HypF [Nitrospiria bacterium]|nr:carbamoyltransferase HypF [Nitrospiria bacterium]